MIASHDPLLCDFAICAVCTAYGDGYRAGKAKAQFEIEIWDIKHRDRCDGCEPCRIVKGIVEKAMYGLNQS